MEGRSSLAPVGWEWASSDLSAGRAWTPLTRRVSYQLPLVSGPEAPLVRGAAVRVRVHATSKWCY